MPGEHQHRVVSSTPESRPRCPVCGGACVALGSVDFNKSCEEARGLRLPASGQLVPYVTCPQCQFSFAPGFAAWTPEDFSREIYNDGYLQVDPDHIEARPRANAESLLATFGGPRRPGRHLDYGGGAGLLSALLREAGWDSASYDPFFDGREQLAGFDRHVQLAGLGQFPLITCYEVFEHVPDVQQLAASLAALLAPDGLILFSTLVSDGELRPGQRPDWWYASPRNGHISLFSSRSLAVLAEKHGFNTGSFNPGLHVWWRGPFPGWAQHLLQGG